MNIAELLIRYLLAAIMTLFGFIKPDKACAGKRAMFLISVYTALVKEGILQEISLESFNKTFQLAEEPNSLEVAQMASFYWDTANLRSELDKCIKTDINLESKESRLHAIQLFCPYVVDQAPKWMRYDTNKMNKELSDVLLVSGFSKAMQGI